MRCEEDYTLTPCGQIGERIALAQGDQFLGEFPSQRDALRFIAERMELERFWPSIYWISDHGDEWPIDLEGAEVDE